MGIRDDFFEALNSVRKDFSKEDHTTLDNSSKNIKEPEVAEQMEYTDLEHDNDLHSAPDNSEPPYPQQDAEGTPVMVGSRQAYDFDDSMLDRERTVISKNTVIRGTLQTEDSLRLLGQVIGDIECKSNIVISGKVQGNTVAANVHVTDAMVEGNLRCDDAISIDNDTWVLGDINAQQADINGKIKGNLDIRNGITIGKNSSIIGNISTDEIEIQRGAFLNGQIMMHSPAHDIMDRFDQLGSGQ